MLVNASKETGNSRIYSTRRRRTRSIGSEQLPTPRGSTEDPPVLSKISGSSDVSMDVDGCIYIMAKYLRPWGDTALSRPYHAPPSPDLKADGGVRRPVLMQDRFFSPTNVGGGVGNRDPLQVSVEQAQ